jgi:hypothetical protein
MPINVERIVKNEIEAFCILLQDMHQKYVKKDESFHKNNQRLFRFAKKTLISEVCLLSIYFYGLIYLEKYLQIQGNDNVTDHDFKLFYTTSVSLAAKMYEDLIAFKSVTFYDKFVLAGEYILLDTFLKSEMIMFQALDYNLVLKEENLNELLQKYITISFQTKKKDV